MMGVDMATARSRAESLMTSTCRIFTKGAPVTNPTTGEVTYAKVDVYVGACKFRPMEGRATSSESGGEETFSFDYLVSVPFAVTGVRAKQWVECLTSPDPDLMGVEVRIQKVARGDNITARRLLCEEVA